jgi:hypothetical protein
MAFIVGLSSISTVVRPLMLFDFSLSTSTVVRGYSLLVFADGTQRMDEQTRIELEAAAFRRLLAHLRERNDVQNIDLMELAGFCRNCLANWYQDAAEAEVFH